MAEGKFFRIRSADQGFHVEVRGAAVVLSAQERDGVKQNEDCQLWFEDSIAGTIRNKMNDLCMDLAEDGKRVVIAPLVEEKVGQQWMVMGTQIQSRGDTSRVLGLADPDGGDNTPLTVQDASGDTSQEWELLYEVPRYFFIRSKMHGKLLEVKGSNPKRGAQVIMYAQKCPQSDNQLWYEDKQGIIRSKINDWVLDATDGDMEVNQFEAGNAHQMWSIHGQYVVNATGANLVLDIIAQKKSDGAKLCGYNNNGQANQRWQFDYVD